MRSSFVLRARIVCGFFILAAVLLAIRLYFVQIVHGTQYQKSALGQYVEPASDTESRGDIFFKKENSDLVAAAVMQSGWRVAIIPKDIHGPGTVYEKLNAVVPVDRARFFASAAKPEDPYEEIALRVSDADAQKIRAQKIPGVILVQDQWRLYPAGELAAQTIGFVGYKGDKKVGVYGLERQWQDTLEKTSSGLYVNPFAEIFTNMEALLSSDPGAHEGSIVTSIEPTVQQHLEDTLDEVMKTYTPHLGGGIVMDPRTGEIYAIAARPAFDPNTYNTVPDAGVFGNPLVENVYEMGSIMKPLTMAAGIDRGVVSPDTTYDDKGCIMKSNKKVCNYDGKARGVVSMQEVLNQSLNTGASFVVDKVGNHAFGRYVHSYGLGERTNIDLPNEAAGIIGAIDRNSDVDFASASFGQGIAVSPIEMTRALSALANQGVLPDPHVVTGVRYDSGLSRSIPGAPGKQVLKPETVDTVTNMLVQVFDNALLHGALKQEHYSIAAKTGTAQIGIPGGGGYYSDRYLHSFFGYFPAHDPKFIVFLFAVEPHGAEFASATLAHPFLDIAKFLINYYNIPPDR